MGGALYGRVCLQGHLEPHSVGLATYRQFNSENKFTCLTTTSSTLYETYGTEFKMKADAYQDVGQHVHHRAASTRMVHTFPCSGMNTHRRAEKRVSTKEKMDSNVQEEKTSMDGLYIVASTDGDT